VLGSSLFGYLTDRFGRKKLCMLSASEGDPIGIRQRRATSFVEITLTELVLGADAERRPLETSRAAPRPGRPDFFRRAHGPAARLPIVPGSWAVPLLLSPGRVGEVTPGSSAYSPYGFDREMPRAGL
jgi:hypothetical protein